MNGAQALIRSLVDAGVDVCFTNPGTSEMHFVAALDEVPDMRGVLALFEGVATGAADGYARIAGRPAAVLLHLGPGLGNGLANLHNARRAGVPVVAIVGDHATAHKVLDAPLESDIETIARNVSPWIRSSRAPGEVGRDAAEAVAAARTTPGRIATLILPADVSWGEGGQLAPPLPVTGPQRVDDDVIAEVAAVLRRDESAVLLLGGDVLADAAALDSAAVIAQATGARLLSEVFPRRLVRGQGVAPIERLGYLAEAASQQLDGAASLVLVGAREPVTFFAYPDKSSHLVPDTCRVHELAGPGDDGAGALAALVGALDLGDRTPPRPDGEPPARPTGDLDAWTVALAVGALLPEGAIVVDEAVTSSLALPFTTAAAPRHDWLTLTGGSIGYGLPAAVGAAIAAPDRKVLCLQADGSAMYTPQALWTMAREELDVTVVVYNNASYEILKIELQRVGAGTGGPKAAELFDLGRPRLDFTALARGMGVPATRADTAEDFTAQLEAALATPGPNLVEAMIPQMV
ncbi:MAG TPA: acetolactate synthase large subunit [Egicoccus sp.]|nr:acetolactate synthase large subunit [Egicoccus sp.]HSK22142.1 acetolactate synthase large subunit [Egicoccus sp.]